jgi:hypothetical protein
VVVAVVMRLCGGDDEGNGQRRNCDGGESFHFGSLKGLVAGVRFELTTLRL